MNFSDEELELLLGSLAASQRTASANYARATDPQEREWLADQMSKLEALRFKLEGPLRADTSQDAEEEDAQ